VRLRKSAAKGAATHSMPTGRGRRPQAAPERNADTVSRMARGQHAPQNAMTDPGEIERFYDRCSDLMRELLDGLALAPDEPRAFPVVEDAIGWPRRRIASVLGGVARLRRFEFEGRRPYRFRDSRQAESGRWEIWMDAAQARAVLEAAAWAEHAGTGGPILGVLAAQGEEAEDDERDRRAGRDDAAGGAVEHE
jgi:hypothetical protein